MHTNRPEFKKRNFIKEGCQIGYQWQNANKVYIFENFSWRLCYRILSQNDLNCFKNRFGTRGFADRQFFFLYKQSWEVLFLLEEDYCLKKFETFMVIFTSGRKRVFFKKRFFISASRTIHLTLNLQARHYRNMNYYNIYTCSFTQYYLSMLRKNKKIECCLLLYSDLFWDVLENNTFFWNL